MGGHLNASQSTFIISVGMGTGDDGRQMGAISMQDTTYTLLISVSMGHLGWLSADGDHLSARLSTLTVPVDTSSWLTDWGLSQYCQNVC